MAYRVRSFLIFTACLLGPGCGGDRHPGAPTPAATPTPQGLAAGAVLSIVSASSGAPVPQATVVVDGRSYVADAAGHVSLSAAARPGALIDVTSPGALDRQTQVATRPSTTLSVWPRTTASGIDEIFTSSIVYTSAAIQGGPPAAERLRRLPPGTQAVVIVPSAEILADDFAQRSHSEAVARLTVAARGAIDYALARERPAAGVIFDAAVRPEDANCTERVRAFTRLALRADEIVGGEIVYCLWDAARTATVAHEMGHTFGLRHSNDSRDLMFGTFVRGRRDDLTEREADVMHLMLQRSGGNRYPDTDRPVAATAAVHEEDIVCR